MELLLLTIITALLALFAILASELGVDSRDFSDDPHRPSYPVSLA
jgi:hypothetical protein